MLYELLTGRPPFLGDDVIAVISQHINTTPVAPSWHQRNVPQVLERLVMRLLAKAPDERPNNAAEVLAALEAIAEAPQEAAPRDEANPLDRLASGVFVGREQELGDLRSSLDEALSGHGRLVLLAGEPGIGKTRLAEELATYAQMRGAQVLWGRCYEGEGAPAYWPWVQAIRSYVYERAPEALLSELGRGAADIAQIVSEVRERLPDLPEPQTLEPEQARFQLFDSITTFLKNASRARPLVLVLDDLHWADKPSLLLLQFLARELRDARFFVLGTYRDIELGRQHPLSHTRAELAREQLSQRIALRGLAERDVARFIEMTGGIEPPAGLVATVYKETEGNPFFVKEVVSLLASEQRLERGGSVASWTVAIPESVREVIGRRLDRLSEACNRVLTVASVIGREFTVEVLELVGGIGGDALLDALEEALAARVIAEAPRIVGTYSFAHGLIRETLYDELTAIRRGRLHRQIGEAVERLYAAKPEPHLAELAYHFAEAAQSGGDVDKAVDYGRRAGERALNIYAWEEAASHFERALENLELKPDTDEALRCDLIVNLGEAQNAGGDAATARETLRRAAHLAQELLPGDDPRRPRLLGRAALALAWALDFDEALKASGSASSLIASSEGTEAAATYLAQAARIAFAAGFMRGAWELAAQGLVYADERRDATWAHLMTYEILHREAEDPDNPGIPLDSPERREVSRIALQLPPDQRPRIASSYASRADILAHASDDDPVALVFFAGEYRRGHVVWREAALQHEKRGQIANAVSDWAQVARCFNALGDFTAAHEACDRAIALASRLGVPSYQTLQIASVRTEMRFTIDPEDQEDVLWLEPLLKQPAAETQWASAALRAVAALSYAWVERTEEALYWLGTLLAPLERAPAWAPNYPLIACLAAYTLWVLERTDHIDVIERSVREKVVGPDFHFPMQNGALSIARLCALDGRLKEAGDWFVKARAVLEGQGARPLHAIADMNEGELYVRRGGEGDHALARPHLDAALRQFHELGMSGWAPPRRAASELTKTGRGCTNRPTFPAWLLGLRGIGALGDGTNTNSSVPVDVSGLGWGIAAVSTGEGQSCALTQMASVKCWGYNNVGQLGDGTTTNRTAPVAVVESVKAPPPFPTCPITDNTPPAAGCSTYNFTASLSILVPDLNPSTPLPCAISGVEAHTRSAVGDNYPATPDLRDDIQIAMYSLSGYVDCPGPLGTGSSLPSGGSIEETTNTNSGLLDFPASGTLSFCLRVDTIPLGMLQNCPDSLPTPQKLPLMLNCTLPSSLGALNCTESGQSQFLNAQGTPEATVLRGWVDFASTSPGDSDGDGCPDVNEQNTAIGSQLTGGRRDYLNPWDYFNPTHDGINRSDDILAVVHKYHQDQYLPSPPNPAYTTNPQYDPGTDRTYIGPNPWNLGPPNGKVRVDDILAIVKQYHHDC